ncbi:transmembrane and immunoglobulin domain-containing protein 1 [Pelodytes ibericus]
MKHSFIQLFVLLSGLYQVSAVGISINNNTHSFMETHDVSSTIPLHCEVYDNTKAETLTWYRGNRQVNVTSDNSVNSSHVCISPASVQDNGVSFTCMLKSNTTVKVSVLLDVKFAPILSGETSVTVEVGKTAQLTCSFLANPTADMLWRQNGNVITMVQSRYEQQLTSNTFQLIISKAVKKDAGNYTCLASINNKTYTREFTLVVEDKKEALPVEAIAAAVVVGALIILFGMFARRDKIFKKCLKVRENTSL